MLACAGKINHVGTGTLLAVVAALAAHGEIDDTSELVADIAVMAAHGNIDDTSELVATPAYLSVLASVADILATHTALAATPAAIFAGGGVPVGVLRAGLAVLVAPGIHGEKGTGALHAGTATLSAAGNKSNTSEMVADAAILAGAGSVSHVAAVVPLQADPATIAAVWDVGSAQFLVAFPATMAASGLRGFVITGNAPFPTTLTGSFTQLFSGNVPFGPAMSGGLVFHYLLSGNVPFKPPVSGDIIVNSTDQASLEAAYEATGIRPIFPITVYVLTALRQSDIETQVPVGKSFIVSASFVATSGDPFYDAGAGPDYIGMRIQPETGEPYNVFRAPVPYEVVWFVPQDPGGELHRYELNRDTGQYAWKKFNSIPERAWSGQYIGTIFDPDKVYDYYARLWGAMMWRLSYDTDVLADQLDPTTVSSFYIATLAAQWGLTLDSSQTLAKNRALTAQAVPSFKFKGLDEGVRLKLQSLGLRGFSREIWVNPTNPANAGYFSLVPMNRDDKPSASALGAGVDYFERPHGYYQSSQDPYWLSSRIAVYVNNSDGTPFNWANAGASFKTAVYNALRLDILPVHVDIRYFGTDVSLLGPDSGEGITVSDSLTVTPV